MKGIIALDIDGTITADHHAISPKVVSYFEKLVAEGWTLIFITGRNFAWGYSVLRHLTFPYFFAVHNGSIILEMPSRRILLRKYLTKEIFSAMEEICHDEQTDFIIYSGFEYGDRIFYRPHRFSVEQRDYFERRQVALEEKWISLETFTTLELAGFSSIKCFGKIEAIERIALSIEKALGLHVPVIRDPFDTRIVLVQATHPEVNKGNALTDFLHLQGKKGCTLIAAGDDNNDKTMLALADVKVVMATAPEAVLRMADVVAPPAEKQGIIEGLEAALKLCSKG